jgi:hypothetical protein
MVEAEEIEALALPVETHKARLCLGQLKPERREQRSQLAQSSLGLRLCATEDDEIVRVAD